jgi:hypothetical protein
VPGEQPNPRKKSADLTLSHKREHGTQDSSSILERSPQYTQNIVGDNKREEAKLQKDETIKDS